MESLYGVDLSSLPASIRPRVALTLSCRDTDVLAKVPDAGEVSQVDGQRVQTMHNGTLVLAGGYHGDWTEAIIRGLRGHHEPQEEVVFDAVLRRLSEDGPDAPFLLEPGCFWAYYSLWFARAFPHGRVLAMEPDPANLRIGEANAELNGVADRIDFREGVVGARPGEPLTFISETTGDTLQPRQYDLAAMLQAAGREFVDILVCDIQGGETDLLEGGRDLLRGGAVRFLMLSTHHHSISGDPLTHERALDLVRDIGGHVIAEHSVAESSSGDGLIAASFDARDRDFTVAVSLARSGPAVFGTTPEGDLAVAWQQRDALLAEQVALRQQMVDLEVVLSSERKALAAANAELGAMRNRRSIRAIERLEPLRRRLARRG